VLKHNAEEWSNPMLASSVPVFRFESAQDQDLKWKDVISIFRKLFISCVQNSCSRRPPISF